MHDQTITHHKTAPRRHLHAVVQRAADARLRIQQPPDLRQHHLPQGSAAPPASNAISRIFEVLKHYSCTSTLIY